MSPKSKGRLIAVSNRTAAGQQSRAGGLAVALWEALTASKGLWVGWSGQIYDFPRQKFKHSKEDGVSFALCDYGKEEFEKFYLGYSNSVLWPVLHGRLDLANFNNDYFNIYQKVSRRYADGIMDVAEPDDLIWVHDYHFLLLGKSLKDRGWTGKCGFFLHVPFPDSGTFRAIPDHEILADGLIAYNVIGLQSRRDVENLAHYLEVTRDAKRLDENRVEVDGHVIVLWHCPIGIDADGFQSAAGEAAANEAAEKLSAFLKGRDLVLGVDRMDYSKGLPQRFEGMAKFFDSHPDFHGKVSFTQIAPPSRSVVAEYKKLRQELDALSGRINGDYGDLDWIPIRYLARGYDREQIAGLYRLAKVCLVTPLNDGMNLVAKEFVAAQNPDDPGVLVLSEFAGAAEQLKEALIINPHDANDISRAVFDALHMSLEERQRRWRALFKTVSEEDIDWWRDRFFAGFDLLDG